MFQTANNNSFIASMYLRAKKQKTKKTSVLQRKRAIQEITITKQNIKELKAWNFQGKRKLNLTEQYSLR